MVDQRVDGLRPSRINCLFMNMLRGYLWSLPEDDLNQLRSNYAAAISHSAVQRFLGLLCWLVSWLVGAVRYEPTWLHWVVVIRCGRTSIHKEPWIGMMGLCKNWPWLAAREESARATGRMQSCFRSHA